MDYDNRNAVAEVEQLSAYLARTADECELCHRPGGQQLWEDALCRIVAVDDADYPGFCRVILNRHVREMTDLDEAERTALMRVVFEVEGALRRLYRPDKVNLASFGNVVAHVHWHVIPRWHDDRHFPQPVWAAPQRPPRPRHAGVAVRELAAELHRRLAPSAG